MVVEGLEIERLGTMVISTGTGSALCSVNGGANDKFHDIPAEKNNKKNILFFLFMRSSKIN